MNDLKEKLQGKLIVFEGCDGAGKTTVINGVAERLWKEGLDVVTTRQPGGTRFGGKVRELLFTDDAREPYDAITEALMMNADRRHHLTHHIIPALEAGKTVLCDRFVLSTLVYQNPSADEELDGLLTQMHVDYCYNFKADHMLLLRCDYDVMVGRMAHRLEKNRLDAMGDEWRQRDARYTSLFYDSAQYNRWADKHAVVANNYADDIDKAVDMTIAAIAMREEEDGDE